MSALTQMAARLKAGHGQSLAEVRELQKAQGGREALAALHGVDGGGHGKRRA